MAADDAVKPAWAAFLDAGEVLQAVSAYLTLRLACGVPEGAFGRPAFDAVREATLASQVPHKTKSLMTALAENWKLRPAGHGTTRVLVSGAGPTGLRAAVEAALMGMRVHVIEKRAEFSRVNILMMWQNTADDMIAYGARTFYPKFTNRRVGTSPLHLGTREIQLVLLKNALLLGVTFSYGTELVALQAPPPPGAAVGAAPTPTPVHAAAWPPLLAPAPASALPPAAVVGGAGEMSLVQMCLLLKRELGMASDMNVKDTVHAAAAALGMEVEPGVSTMELARHCRAALVGGRARPNTGASEAGLAPVRAPLPVDLAGGGGSGWSAWCRSGDGKTNQTANSVLAFKPNKTSDYAAGVGQGKCNMLQLSELDPSFALPAGEAPPEGIDTVGFDALLLAEGEWSQTCVYMYT